eukprot:CAMPEP_0182441344 /NCGR_PEP_ID=MMETSP1172-20130603/275_1 /TAXON_ID=708627 /ORGANISM="Timspurckia oligopyrenoides, Strain CCMP3278" /LENGTH=905 /DNA_ID=CAMNT_0024635545 /DNA_START=29 /DNA_END=2746 /DNA_ORIENTATION=-
MASKSSKGSTSSSSSILPSKEQSLFRNLVQLYETKQYKKSIKVADQILRKYPNHGETLAMKGLVLSCIDRKSEAYELVRLGLRSDLRSHVCWHVYGLLYRADRDYKEASKAYLQALRIDKDNIQILRDLALLQIQNRDLDGFESTRRTLLTLKPNQKNNWIGFAVANHVNGNLNAALNVLETYEGTLNESTTANGKDSENQEERYEVSELEMYKVMIMYENGDYEKVYEYLLKNESKMVDKLAVAEMKAKVLFNLEKIEDSIRAFDDLLKINSENREYLSYYLKCSLRMNEMECFETWNPDLMVQELRDYCLSVCDDLAIKYPDSMSFPRAAMEFSREDAFLKRADVFVRPLLRKAVPSLFSILKHFYSDPAKARILGNLMESFRKSLNQDSPQFPPLTSSENTSESNPEQPHVLLWVLYYLVLHYDEVGEYEKAIEIADLGISHTDSCIDIYLAKAKAMKHKGDRRGAVEIMNHARKLDLSDRYLNHKCSKYAMQADRVDLAEEWISLFTRDGEFGGIQALYDMQCMWYELEAGDAFLRLNEFSKALKRYIAVNRHFDDILEDQFDFHTYCLRKVTLRSYINTIRMENHVKEQRYYIRSVKGLARLFFRISNETEEQQMMRRMTVDELELEKATPAERKKILAKRKKAQLKKDAAAESVKLKAEKDESVTKKTQKGPARPPGWMEIDPDGIELLRNVSDYQEEAFKYVDELRKWAPNDIDTQSLVFEAAFRKQKYLVALKSVLKAIKIAPNHAKTVDMVALFFDFLENDSLRKNLPAAVDTVLKSEEIALRERGNSAVDSITYYARRTGDVSSSYRQVSAGKALFRLIKSRNDSNAFLRQQALDFLCEWDTKASLDVRELEEVIFCADEYGLSSSELDTFREACKKKYPDGNAFGGGALTISTE